MLTYARAPSLAIGVMLALIGSLGAQPRAIAQTKRGASKVAAAPAHKALDAKAAAAIAQKLASRDEAAVREGLSAAEAAGPGAAKIAPAIEALLRKGATAPIVRASLDALAAIGAPSSSAAIRPYLRHRVAELRRAAARALGATRGPEAAAALRAGLRSPDGVVRGLSAAALGALGDDSALPDLFLALDRDVPEAAPAIGQLCAPAACEVFMSKLGKIAFDVMTSGIDPILLRPSGVSDEQRIKVIEQVRDLGTPDAAKYLSEVATRWPSKASARVKHALERALAAMPKPASKAEGND